MAPANIRILTIDPASDGTGQQAPPNTAWYPDDAYYLEKLAEKWAKEKGEPTGFAYRLDRLPAGYGGFAKQREGSKHIDRYFYGHPSGKPFRSINEIFPHFQQLQEQQGTVGCPCILCSGKKPQNKTSACNSVSSVSPSEKSRFFASGPSRNVPIFIRTAPKTVPDFLSHLPQGRLSSDPPTPPTRRKQVDDEGTPDLYRGLIEKLEAAGPEGSLDEDIFDSMSPDWRAGNEILHKEFAEWSTLPGYMPRLGEVVLFARNISDEPLIWDRSTQALRLFDRHTQDMLDPAKWEAGVVTQLPVEPLSDEDLFRVPDQKQKNVTYSGFRVEPLSEPSNTTKNYTRQHKYTPLHAIRPFSFWKECVATDNDTQWHPTIKHALTLASSLCILGKFSFRGTWPSATLFARAVYLGPEMVMVGDVVRLLPKSGEQRSESVTDVMVVSSIRLRFVNLDEASADDYDDGSPYINALHICGKAFTKDPKRSFAGIGKSPVTPGQNGAPEALSGYGTWFHVVDPANDKAKLEVPFQRVLGRCYDVSAVRAWFAAPTDLELQASNTKPIEKSKDLDISRGLSAVRQAREYSKAHDIRVDRAGGKSWFWADTRIEQLDLHEVNSRYVGVKDENRNKRAMHAWRQALKVLDGKRGGVEAYHAARKQKLEDENRRESVPAQGSRLGLMAAQLDSTDAEEAEDNGKGADADADAMDVDELAIPSARAGAAHVIDLSAEDDEEDEGANTLMTG